MNTLSLAEFHTSLEGAASVLEGKPTPFTKNDGLDAESES
jgi:hypothetical protein